MRLLFVMTGVRIFYFQCWHAVQVTLQWKPLQQRAQQMCHWWVWGAQGTNVAFVFYIPMALQAQLSLSLLCWLIQVLWCKQGPENILYSTRTAPNYAFLGPLPLKKHLFQRQWSTADCCSQWFPTWRLVQLLLCTWLLLKSGPVSGTHAQSLPLQNTQPDIKLLSSVHVKFPSEPEILDLFLA